MATRSRRVRLVIDASVLQAAGEGPANTSRLCRDFLQTVLDVCHHAHACKELTGEWRGHRSGFSRRWLLSMFSRKKVEIGPVNAALREAIEDLAFSFKQRNRLLKDLHLVETALQGDGRVVSLDESSRELFAKAAASIAALRPLVWVNPTRLEDAALEWVRAMCPRDRHRTLGRFVVR